MASFAQCLPRLPSNLETQEEAFSSRILHYTSSLRGTKQCLQRQLSRLLSMVDTLGFPTVFFAHSAADLQWPELAYLPGNPESRNERAKAVIEKPAIAYWFFYHRVMEFVEVLYTGVLGATDHWLRFEWQHRGSSYVHGLAWLPDTPDVEKLGDSTNNTVEEEILSYADQLVSTINPRCSNIAATSNKDIDQDQADLVATCQQHTYFTFYCLHTKHGKQECPFGDPILLQPHTAIVTEDEPTLFTAGNDGIINNFNPVQLPEWNANVDMQYIVSRQRVLQYCGKYSQSLKEIFTSIVHSLNTSLKAVWKLLINTEGERDYSAQGTATFCYNFSCSRHLMISSSLALMDFMLLSTTWKRDRMLQHCPMLTTILDVPIHLTSTP